jgi:hypothetical protein
MQADLTWVHESEGHPSAILFLVHGTFAKPSNWTNSGSQFCQSLLRLLGPDTSIRCFTWSGKNSLGAREKAANRLRGLLIDSVARFPGIKHFVIGHSHGGNVALKSVASPALADVGIVCLSTPILYGLERTTLTRSNNFLFFILSIPAVGAFAFLLTLGLAQQ